MALKQGRICGERRAFLKIFQIVIDCKDPGRLVKFWSLALGYVPELPPKGFPSWMDFYTELGLPKEDLFEGTDCIVDPDGKGPRIWFHIVPESKICKNRLHFDLGVSGGFGVPMNIRKERVEAEAERLIKIGATSCKGVPLRSPWTTQAIGSNQPRVNQCPMSS
jgi:Glyoxalase-like domain